ncbi:hypothetical protein E2542_SST15671 [Spatholobus suberectus]|nr:hypothetical protein E2542_SST15671 [Spatholobus suberectus]
MAIDGSFSLYSSLQIFLDHWPKLQCFSQFESVAQRDSETKEYEDHCAILVEPLVWLSATCNSCQSIGLMGLISQAVYEGGRHAYTNSLPDALLASTVQIVKECKIQFFCFGYYLAYPLIST